MAKQFKNESFWQDFHDKLQDDTEDVQERVELIKEMIDCTIYDYQFNTDAKRTFKLVTQLDTVMEKFFDQIANQSLDEEKLNDLTELCRRINEDPIMQEIRDAQVLNDIRGDGSNTTHKKKTQVKAGQVEEPNQEKSLKKKESYEGDIGREEPISPTKLEERTLTAKGDTEMDEEPNKKVHLKNKKSDPLDIKQTSTNNTSDNTNQIIKQEITIEDTKKQSLEKVENKIPQHVEPVKDVKKEFDDLLALLKHSYTESLIEDAFDHLEVLKTFEKRDNLPKNVKTHIESAFKENASFFAQIGEEKKGN
jgi:hypothetical protein